MNVQIQFYSYLRERTGCERLARTVPSGTTLGQLHQQLCDEFPVLEQMRRATLLAVGVDYQPADHQLQDGDLVSLFPPVQGG